MLIPQKSHILTHLLDEFTSREVENVNDVEKLEVQLNKLKQDGNEGTKILEVAQS